MKPKSIFLLILPIVLFATACKDTKSYNELLDEEEKAVNSFLANQRVVLEVPADTVFETGEDAPFYKLDEDGNVYMQVIKAGDRKNNKAETGQNIYFRYMRIDLKDYETGVDPDPIGNENSLNYSYFSYNNYQLPSTSQYGYGIQMPLAYLGIDCEVNILIKSQYGFSSEISNVIPYIFHITYYRQKV